MTDIRDFEYEKSDPRYALATEYQPIGTVNDPGISNVPASPDHSHQLFDNGTDLTPYLRPPWQMYDPAKPARLYRAGNQIIIDGAFTASHSNEPVIFSVPTSDPNRGLWNAAYEVRNQSALIEDDVGVLLFPAEIMVTPGFAFVRVEGTDFDTVGTVGRLTVNAFTWRTDSSSTTEFSPEGFDVFRWDTCIGWDVSVWGTASGIAPPPTVLGVWDSTKWDRSYWG